MDDTTKAPALTGEELERIEARIVMAPGDIWDTLRPEYRAAMSGRAQHAYMAGLVDERGLSKVARLCAALREAQARAEKAETALEMSRAEVDVLRGEGGCEANGDGPCGACLRCLRRQAEKAEKVAAAERALRLAIWKGYEGPCEHAHDRDPDCDDCERDAAVNKAGDALRALGVEP